jgi:chromate reductase, NAD(P)H dehydrogenase (quinone)
MRSDTLRVLAVPGSLRRGSYNRRLLATAAERAPETMAVTLFDGLGAIPLFDEDVEAGGLPAGVRALRDEVAASNGVLIATPEYNRSIPGVLKNAIDWLSRCDDVLAGKPVAVIGATLGPWGTRLAQHALLPVLHAIGAPVMPGPALFAGNAAQLFDAQGGLVDPRTADSLDAVLVAFERWLRRFT